MTLVKDKRNLILTGVAIGIISVALVLLGNPGNMGFCIACFLRDIAGAVKLQTAGVVQYVRPEIIGLILGSFIISLLKGEFKPRGGSAPITRFFIAFMVMIGALVFLGCPFRMVLRLAAGDLNALVALAGFASGIAIGCYFLSKGFSLGRARTQTKSEGVVLPASTILLFVLFIAVPSIFAFSTSGPGSMHAPIIASLAAGLIVGIMAQRTRMCMVGGIRDVILVKDWTLLGGFIAIFASALVMNIATGKFNLGFAGQPVAHSQHVWNFLGMLVVGLGSALLGGCPLRQLVLAGEGNTDSAVAVLGLIAGAAFAHNFSLASSAYSATSVGGPSIYGKVAVIGSIAILLAIASINTFIKKREA
ncbi:MAG: YedE-related selenium metabolism membrane protein [Spirochaetales bacterium]|nr:YedE-related selenium metabolism membrane protein [Spirochaetales bacterium]